MCIRDRSRGELGEKHVNLMKLMAEITKQREDKKRKGDAFIEEDAEITRIQRKLSVLDAKLETYKRSELDAELDSQSCLLYTSPSPRDQRGSRMPSSA
eukprot:TRINITY_DN20180_c0_g1_i1.p1 TRINITY_DN20180_c0_g1~~TRINITY_DN20180_c0_g1_i1.p1  ORF type:complete len:113 (-),score=50.62 TRINITY_DN20180_c0_g1_i1:12-305(-)